MRSLVTAVLLLLVTTVPLVAEIKLSGSDKFGQSLSDYVACEDDVIGLKMCQLESLSPAKIKNPSPIDIRGEASLGLKYDGSRISPVSKFELIFEFRTKTNSGLIVGARTTIDGNED